MFKNDNLATVFHREALKMITCFVAISGHVAAILLENRHTVNAEWYVRICSCTDAKKQHTVTLNLILIAL